MTSQMQVVSQAPISIANPYHVFVPGSAGGPSTSIGERIRALHPQEPSGAKHAPQTDSHIELQLFDVGAEFKVRTSLIAMHLTREHRDRLFTQIDSLLDSEEWDSDDKLPTVGSLDTFLRLQFAMQMSRRPALGATFHGNLVAAWILDEGDLTIECLPNDILKWAVMRRLRPKNETGAGSTTIARIREVLAPYGVGSWTRKTVCADGK